MHGLEDQHIVRVGRMCTDYKLPDMAVRLFSWPSNCSFVYNKFHYEYVQISVLHVL